MASIRTWAVEFAWQGKLWLSLNKSSPLSIGFFFTKSPLFSNNIFNHSVYLLPCFPYPNFAASIKCVVKDFSSSYSHGPGFVPCVTRPLIRSYNLLFRYSVDVGLFSLLCLLQCWCHLCLRPLFLFLRWFVVGFMGLGFLLALLLNFFLPIWS